MAWNVAGRGRGHGRGRGRYGSDQPPTASGGGRGRSRRGSGHPVTTPGMGGRSVHPRTPPTPEVSGAEGLQQDSQNPGDSQPLSRFYVSSGCVERGAEGRSYRRKNRERAEHYLTDRIKRDCDELEQAYQDQMSWHELCLLVTKKYLTTFRIEYPDSEQLKTKLDHAYQRFYREALSGYLEEVEEDTKSLFGQRHIKPLREILKASALLDHPDNQSLLERTREVVLNLTESEMQLLEFHVNFPQRRTWAIVIQGIENLVNVENSINCHFHFCDFPAIRRLRARRNRVQNLWDCNIHQPAEGRDPIAQALLQNQLESANSLLLQKENPSPYYLRILSDLIRIQLTEISKHCSQNEDIPSRILLLNALCDFIGTCKEGCLELEPARRDLSIVLSGLTKAILGIYSGRNKQNLDLLTLRKIADLKNYRLLDRDCLELWEASYTDDEPVDGTVLLSHASIHRDIQEVFGLLDEDRYHEAIDSVARLVQLHDEINKLPAGKSLNKSISFVCRNMYQKVFKEITDTIDSLRYKPYEETIKCMAKFQEKSRQASRLVIILEGWQRNNWGKTVCKIWGQPCVQLSRVDTFSEEMTGSLLTLKELAVDVPCHHTRVRLKEGLVVLFTMAIKSPDSVQCQRSSINALAEWCDHLVTVEETDEYPELNATLVETVRHWREHLQLSEASKSDEERPQAAAVSAPVKQASLQKTTVAAQPSPTPVKKKPSVAPPQSVIVAADANAQFIPYAKFTPYAMNPVTVWSQSGQLCWNVAPVLINVHEYQCYWQEAVKDQVITNIQVGLKQIKSTLKDFDSTRPGSTETPTLDTRTIKPLRAGVKQVFDAITGVLTDAEKDYLRSVKDIPFPVAGFNDTYWKLLIALKRRLLNSTDLKMYFTVQYIEHFFLALHSHLGLLQK